jgi:LmbE family N-acetylglucosaminyl deacetylase
MFHGQELGEVSMDRISLRSILSVVVVVLGLMQPRALKAQATLENPAPGSFQSGIGTISGWACQGQQILIEIDGVYTLPAAYGTEREDTQSVCGDINNGFGLLVNWNNFGDGHHTLRALADGKEFGRVTFTITTLGTDFLRGARRRFTLFDFPLAGTELLLRWQESLQNFAIDSVKVNELAAQLSSGKVLWIGAHPDDEVSVASLLGDICVERGASCTLLVMTRGEAGPCKRPQGCLPNLATVRTQEMQAAAALFHAALIQWNLADVPGPTPQAVLNAWSQSVGGEDALVERMATAIQTVAPDVVLTFDPRIGATCHPGHRAVAALTLAALERLDLRTPDAYLRQLGEHIPVTFLLASRIEISQNAIRFSVAVPEDQNLRGYDAAQPLALVKATGWEYVLRNAQLHASQFDAVLLSALKAVPNSQRQLFFLSRADATTAVDVRYDQVCGP